tara:strand:+ start:13552 stop:15288 length:1737 start_codon:yes stop_codon:yes gene_type:complete
MINQFFGILRVIGKQNRLRSLFLLLVLLCIIFLELLNFSLIIPILSIIFNNGSKENFFLNFIETQFNFNFENIFIIGTIFFTVLIVKIIILLLFEYILHKYSRRINVDITLKAYSYFLHSPWQEIFKKNHGYMMRNILGDTGVFIGQGLMKFIELFKNTVLLTFILGYLFFVNLKVTFLILILLIFFISIFYLVFKRKFISMSEEIINLDAFKYKNISESILNLRDIKLTGSANYFLNLFETNENKVTKVVIADAILSKLPRYLIEIIIVLFVFGALVFFNLKNIDMVNLIPILGLYGFAALRMIPIFLVYNSSLQSIKMGKFQIDEVIKNAGRFSEFYREKEQKDKKIENINQNYNQNLEILVSDLYFGYSDKKEIFKNINLILKKNNTIFLEGSNGSGKSTFVDLISGMLRPNKGSIRINGINLEDISDSWKDKIGYVSQSNYLINSSIKNNIVFGRKNISDKNINDVLKIVGLDTLINELPEKLSTNVGNLGASLSGGQKQKISIARALVADPKVIILDEATNALDIEGEKKFLEIINKIKKDKIIIFIAHSNTIKNFCDISFKIKDKNIVFEES